MLMHYCILDGSLKAENEFWFLTDNKNCKHYLTDAYSFFLR